MSKEGYGQLSIRGVNMLAHRVAYAEAHQLDPSSMGGVVMHTCDNKWCVNPDHLVLGTQQDNMDDKVAKGRQARGTKHGMVKLTDSSILSIRNRYTPGNGVALAKEFGVSRRLIGKIVRRELWVWI
jgi:hypothetical protein